MVNDIMAWCTYCNADDLAADLIAALRAVEGMYIEWQGINRNGLLYAQQRRWPLWQRTSQFRIYESFLIPKPCKRMTTHAPSSPASSNGSCCPTMWTLRHLLTATTLPSVSLGVIPLDIDRIARPTESFWIFDKSRVSVELVSGDLTITQPNEISAYERRFVELTAQAVYGAKARKLIAEAIAATARDVA